eukprot:TRINITY_DN3403_c0_g1_i1.p1 TRINITY_DN3403_c0_g1~~TRINITY_DN3403_c0_g1_i1.p1  ORF type:complete len:190 (-),score=23.87 TRINITY_DN3403_c0_g1_i1:78-614(-)
MSKLQDSVSMYVWPYFYLVTAVVSFFAINLCLAVIENVYDEKKDESEEESRQVDVEEDEWVENHMQAFSQGGKGSVKDGREDSSRASGGSVPDDNRNRGEADKFEPPLSPTLVSRKSEIDINPDAASDMSNTSFAMVETEDSGHTGKARNCRQNTRRPVEGAQRDASDETRNSPAGPI